MTRFLSLLVLACAAAGAAAAAVPVIENPGEAPLRRTVHHAEIWRAGADDEAEFIFGLIRDAVTDAAGNLYLLDTQQQQVFKFSPAGDYLGLVSRRGEGPGEINMVYHLTLLDEDRLGMIKVFPPQVVTVALDGTPQPSIHISVRTGEDGQASVALSDLGSRDGHLVGTGRIMTGFSGDSSGQITYVSAFDAEGVEQHSFLRCVGGYDFNAPITVHEAAEYCPGEHWTLGAGGELYQTTTREEPVIEVRDMAGVLKRRIRFDLPVHRRSDQQKEEAKNEYVFGGNTELPTISYDIADTDPAFADINVIGDELWVQTPQLNRDLPEGVVSRRLICDLEGNLLEERSFALPYDRERDSRIHLPDGRIVRIRNYRAAARASQVGLSVQRGEGGQDEDEGDDPEDVVLEVIVYAPLD